MEDCFRGYLLTGNKSFLAIYDQDSVSIPRYYSDLQAATSDTSIQTSLLYQIRNLYNDWKNNFAEKAIVLKKQSLLSKKNTFEYNKLFSANADQNVGKPITDLIRSKFREFNSYEYRVREIRRTNLNTSVSHTGDLSLVLIGAAFLLGLIGAIYVTRQITTRIFKMVTAAEKISEGDLKVEVHDDQKDELTSLSQSLTKMAHKLDENFTDLEQKNNDLKQFAYVVSHDLKAPLRGMETVLSWIDDDFKGGLDPRLQEYHQMIRGRIKRMENLISGILEISRVGRIQKPVEKVNVNELLMEIIDNCSPPPGMKIDVQPDIPVLITERILLQQVLTNLISNAIKYHHTKEGHISISYQNGEQHQFTVKDDGPGIDPAYHKKIFEMFQTLQERDAFESTGVGLALVKKIVEDKGGVVKVVSEPGKGAAFTFTWPKFGDLKG